MELEDIVLKLVGPVAPVGESNEDARRLGNLKELTELVDRLLYRISDVSVAANRQEASMKALGLHARDFLRSVREGWRCP
jgi:hypothetical protein